MQPSCEELYLAEYRRVQSWSIVEWWQHTKVVFSLTAGHDVMYSVSREANLVDQVLTLITECLHIRFLANYEDQPVEVEATDDISKEYCEILKHM